MASQASYIGDEDGAAAAVVDLEARRTEFANQLFTDGVVRETRADVARFTGQTNAVINARNPASPIIGPRSVFPTKISLTNTLYKVLQTRPAFLEAERAAAAAEAAGGVVEEVDDNAPVNEVEVAAIVGAIEAGIEVRDPGDGAAAVGEVAGQVAAVNSEVAEIAAEVRTVVEHAPATAAARAPATAAAAARVPATAAAAARVPATAAPGLSVWGHISARASAIAGWLRATSPPTTMYSFLKDKYDTDGKLPSSSNFKYKHPLYERLIKVVPNTHPLHTAAAAAFTAGVTANAAAYDLITSFLHLSKIRDARTLSAYHCVLLENYFKYVYLYNIKLAQKNVFARLYARLSSAARANLGTTVNIPLSQYQTVGTGFHGLGTVNLAGNMSPRELIGINYIIFNDISLGSINCDPSRIVAFMGLLTGAGEGSIPTISPANMADAQAAFQELQTYGVSVTRVPEPSALTTAITGLTSGALFLIGIPLRVYDLLTSTISSAWGGARSSFSEAVSRGAGGGSGTTVNAGKRTAYAIGRGIKTLISKATGPMARLIAAGALGNLADLFIYIAKEHGAVKQILIDNLGNIYISVAGGAYEIIAKFADNVKETFNFGSLISDNMLVDITDNVKSAHSAAATHGGGGGSMSSLGGMGMSSAAASANRGGGGGSMSSLGGMGMSSAAASANRGGGGRYIPSEAERAAAAGALIPGSSLAAQRDALLHGSLLAAQASGSSSMSGFAPQMASMGGLGLLSSSSTGAGTGATQVPAFDPSSFLSAAASYSGPPLSYAGKNLANVQKKQINMERALALGGIPSGTTTPRTSGAGGPIRGSDARRELRKADLLGPVYTGRTEKGKPHTSTVPPKHPFSKPDDDEENDDMTGKANQGGGARRTRRYRRNPNKKIRKTHRHRSTHKHSKAHVRRVRSTRRR